MQRRRGLETVVRLDIKQNGQKSHCRPFFTKYKRSSGGTNENSGKVEQSIRRVDRHWKERAANGYVRFESDTDLQEEFLFCTPLTIATGTDIFNVVDNFQQKEGIR